MSLSGTSRAPRAIAVSLIALVLAACSPAPEPTPSPTAAFASEQEAFAAAEETYRAYLKAAAARSDGESAADVEQFLTGTALEADVQAQRDLANRGLRIVGESRIQSFVGTESDVTQRVATLSAEICLDIRESRVLDASGRDVTPIDRPTIGKLLVMFSGTTSKLLISGAESNEAATC